MRRGENALMNRFCTLFFEEYTITQARAYWSPPRSDARFTTVVCDGHRRVRAHARAHESIRHCFNTNT
jgi:hypothetical protein